MKAKIILSLTLAFFLIAFTLGLYSGESSYYDLTNEIENLQNFTCNITSERYDLEGLNFSVNDTGFIIHTQVNYKPDNLTISCLLNGIKEVKSNSPSQIILKEDSLEEQYKDTLKENEKILFNIGSNHHTFTLKKVYKNYATFSMRSEEQIFNLSIGECKIINLEERVKVCLLDIISRKADISIESIKNEETNKTIIEENKTNNSVIIENNNIEPKEEKDYSWIINISAFILGVILVLIFRTKKKKETYEK